MREEVLHYIWQNRLYNSLSLNGGEVDVVQVGTYNDGNGPDFSLVKIRTPELLWAGSVEIHLKSSDWLAHGHDRDNRYCGVLLHVVLEHDMEITDTLGRTVPTAILKIAPEIIHRVNELDMGQRALRCTPELSIIATSAWKQATSSLLKQRIEKKITRLTTGIEHEGTSVFFYYALMRYCGAHLNNDAMEMTAKSLPYSFLRKHASNLTVLEALLIGQAGLIKEVPRDEYEAKLKEEYTFYRTKFGLSPISSGLFRKLRIRPSSYPARRLATVAVLLTQEQELLQLMTTHDWHKIEQRLQTPPSEYWLEHIDFGQKSNRKMRGLGEETIRSIMINVIIPTAYCYAQIRGKEGDAVQALNYLKLLPKEKNKIIQMYENNGMCIENAADSQCAIELYTDYCIRHRCLSCPVAPEIFKSIYHHD